MPRSEYISRAQIVVLPISIFLLTVEFLSSDNNTVLDNSGLSTSLALVVLSGKSWEYAGKHGWLTWQRHTGRSIRLSIATDVRICDVPRELLYLQNGLADYGSAQGRFIDVILNFPVDEKVYLFLVDDDAFVVTHNVIRFYRTYVLRDRDPGYIYGQLKCSTLCGGGGVLISPRALVRLRANREQLKLHCMSSVDPPIYRFWDVCVSEFAFRIGVTLVDREGNFNSQPPNFGQRERYDEDSLKRFDDLPLTFHYVDAYHQTLYSDHYGYKCKNHSDNCISLIPQLYKEFYARRLPSPTRVSRNSQFC